MTSQYAMASLVGIPFAEQGYDCDGCHCWGLVWLATRELYGRTLPRYEQWTAVGAAPEEIESLTGWTKVNEAQLGDVVLFRLWGKRVHVGLIVAHRRMLHIEKKTDSTIDRIDSPRWARRLVGYYRYGNEQR